MNGSATPLAQFLSNSSARFIVPVYQRPYSWTERHDNGRGSWCSYSLPGVNVHRQEDWPTILAFHEKWGLRLWKAVEPFLQS